MDGLIISGGSVDEKLALSLYQEQCEKVNAPSFPVIAADRGLEVCRRLGIPVEEAVGDFDSSSLELLEKEQISIMKSTEEAYPEKDGETQTDPEQQVWKEAAFYRDAQGTRVRTLPAMKDWTDTDMAVHLAIEKGWKKAVVLGGTGTRLDHVLGNLQAMEMALEQRCVMILLDPHNRIQMVDSRMTLDREKQWGHYVSIIPWGGSAQGLTLSGFIYNVNDYTLSTDEGLGISNQIEQPQARVSLKKGKVLVVESRD